MFTHLHYIQKALMVIVFLGTIMHFPYRSCVLIFISFLSPEIQRHCTGQKLMRQQCAALDAVDAVQQSRLLGSNIARKDFHMALPSWQLGGLGRCLPDKRESRTHPRTTPASFESSSRCLSCSTAICKTDVRKVAEGLENAGERWTTAFSFVPDAI